MKQHLQIKKAEQPEDKGDQTTACEQIGKTNDDQLREGYKHIAICLSPDEAAQLEWLQRYYPSFKELTPQKIVSRAIAEAVPSLMFLTKRQRANRGIGEIPFPPGGDAILRRHFMDESQIEDFKKKLY